ncbi:Cysteine/Histidine-rich C1 domain family protein [Hirschfeldia incana]|nr:Cysteine/Histidine-rich C1 domain family protein [Hirschfeldia incana]
MGRPKPEDSIRHFSHPHPLFNSSLNPQANSSSSSSTCVVCKFKLLNLPSYTCKPCNFHIHLKCSELPQNIRHPFDKNHLLSLISCPKYQEGHFRCDACGKNGDGFAYHCGDCGIDLHTVCANMPSRVTHQSHPHHQLSLTFSVPSRSGSGSGSRSAAAASFRCSVCQGLGSNSWLYSCKECGGFDAHLLCARRKLASPTNVVQVGPSPMQPQFIATTPFANVPSQVFNNPYPLVMPTMNPIIRPLINEMINNLVSNTPQSPSQVSQLLDLLGPFGLGGGSGSSSSSGYLGFDPSVFSSADQTFGLGGGSGSSSSSGYLGFDPSGFSSVDQPFGLGGGFGSSSSPGYLGFDPSVFSSVDPSVFAGFDPSLLSTLFSGLGFLS